MYGCQVKGKNQQCPPPEQLQYSTGGMFISTSISSIPHLMTATHFLWWALQTDTRIQTSAITWLWPTLGPSMCLDLNLFWKMTPCEIRTSTLCALSYSFTFVPCNHSTKLSKQRKTNYCTLIKNWYNNGAWYNVQYHFITFITKESLSTFFLLFLFNQWKYFPQHSFRAAKVQSSLSFVRSACNIQDAKPIPVGYLLPIPAQISSSSLLLFPTLLPSGQALPCL